MARKNGTPPFPVDARTGHEIEIADDLKAEVFGDKYGHDERALRVSASISKPEEGVNHTNKFGGKSRISNPYHSTQMVAKDEKNYIISD
jgi:hypothetical protein